MTVLFLRFAGFHSFPQLRGALVRTLVKRAQELPCLISLLLRRPSWRLPPFQADEIRAPAHPQHEADRRPEEPYLSPSEMPKTPRLQDLVKFRSNLKDYERQGVANLLRLPFQEHPSTLASCGSGFGMLLQTRGPAGVAAGPGTEGGGDWEASALEVHGEPAKQEGPPPGAQPTTQTGDGGRHPHLPLRLEDPGPSRPQPARPARPAQPAQPQALGCPGRKASAFLGATNSLGPEAEASRGALRGLSGALCFTAPHCSNLQHPGQVTATTFGKPGSRSRAEPSAELPDQACRSSGSAGGRAIDVQHQRNQTLTSCFFGCAFNPAIPGRAKQRRSVTHTHRHTDRRTVANSMEGAFGEKVDLHCPLFLLSCA